MEGEYRFKVNTCPSCKCPLTDKTSSMVGFYRDVIPMGACPKCGEQIRLDASPETSKVVLDYEPSVPQEVAEVVKAEVAEVVQAEVCGMSQGQGQGPEVSEAVTQAKPARSKARRR